MIVITATVNGQKCYLAGIESNSNAIMMTSSLKEAKRFSYDDLEKIEFIIEIITKYYPDAETTSDDLDPKIALEITEDLKKQIDIFNSIAGDALLKEWTEKQIHHFDEFEASLHKTYRLLGAAISTLKTK